MFSNYSVVCHHGVDNYFTASEKGDIQTVGCYNLMDKNVHSVPVALRLQTRATKIYQNSSLSPTPLIKFNTS